MALDTGNPPDEIYVATIDQVELAIFDALKTVSGLATVERFATNKATMTQEEILAMTGGKSPAAVLIQGKGTVEDKVVTLAQGSAESVDNIEWMVILVVVDTKQPKAALTGDGINGLPGAYALQSRVFNTINGLFIPGLWNDSQINTKGHEWGLVVTGKLYVNVMRFTTAVVLGQAPDIDTSRDLDEIDASFNVGDTLDPPHAVLIDSAVIDTDD